MCDCVQTDPYSLPDVLMIVITADRARIKDHPTAFVNEREGERKNKRTYLYF